MVQKLFSKSMRIVYAGNIGYGQGLEKIIIPLAISMNKEINFTIIGDGSSKHEIVNKIKKFNLTNIEILKPLNRDEPNQLLQLCRLSLFTLK